MKLRKLTGAVLAAFLVFSLCACGSPAQKDQTAESSETPPADSAETPPTESAQETAADPGAAVVFEDQVLEGMVRDLMGKPDGDITVKDALAATNLNLEMDGSDWSNPRIRSLEGLQYFTNLTSLTLNFALSNDGLGVDLTPLSGLTNLVQLYLFGTDIRDLSPLSDLANIEELWINGCGLSDISALSGMTKMDTLWIKNNYISDISPLSGMTSLNRLYMEDNAVTDLSALAGLTKLSELTLADNPVMDYSVLREIAPGLAVKDFEPDQGPQPISFHDTVLEQRVRALLQKPSGGITIADTMDVTELRLGNEWQDTVPEDMKIKDIRVLRYFPNLVKLDLMLNGVEDIGVAAALPKLQYLDMLGNTFWSTAPLSNCRQLTYLNLEGGGFASVQPLADLTKLETLNLNYCFHLQDLSPLAGLTQLKNLYLDGISADLLPPLKNIYPNLIDKNFELPG